MKNKCFLCLAVLFYFSAISLKVEAQGIISDLEMSKAGEGTIRIVCDSKIIALLGTPTTSLRPSEENVTGTGFRIQIYMDNSPRARNEVTRIEGLFNETFPETGVYVSYNAPNWRVFVGDFRTKEEAEAFQQSIRKSLPEFGREMSIVPGKINLSIQK